MSGPAWSTVNPGLISIFTAIASSSEGTVQTPAWSSEWRDRKVTAAPVSGVMDSVKLYLKITSVVGIGEDDRRLVDDGVPGDDLQETLYGLRRVTLNLQATSTKVSDAQWSLSILERIRTRLRRRRIIDQLLALDVGIIRIMQVLDLSRLQDQKTQSRASMDVILTMLSSDSDPVTTGWFNSIVITSHVQDVSGVELPAPPNYLNKSIP